MREMEAKQRGKQEFIGLNNNNQLDNLLKQDFSAIMHTGLFLFFDNSFRRKIMWGRQKKVDTRCAFCIQASLIYIKAL